MKKKDKYHKLEGENFLSPSLSNPSHPLAEIDKKYDRRLNVIEKSGWLNTYQERTRLWYKKTLLEFLTFLEIDSLNGIQKVSKDDVESYVNEMRKNELSPESIESRLSSLSSFFSFLIRQNFLYGNNPTKEIKRPNVDRDVVKNRALRPEEVETIMGTPDTSSIKGLRDKAILALLFYAGCQISQVCRLLVKDYQRGSDDEGKFLHVKTSKGEKIIQVESCLKNVLEKYLDAAGHKELPESPLIQSVAPTRKKSLEKRQIDNIFKEYIQKAGFSASELSAQSARETYKVNTRYKSQYIK